jgi:antitoxin CptB
MTTDTPPNREHRIKRLLFQSRHRGMREADYLIGGFAERHLTSLTDSEIDAFERLLDEPDPDVIDWILERTPAPTSHQGRILDLIIKFKNEQ